MIGILPLRRGPPPYAPPCFARALTLELGVLAGERIHPLEGVGLQRFQLLGQRLVVFAGLAHRHVGLHLLGSYTRNPAQLITRFLKLLLVRLVEWRKRWP